MLKTKSFEFNRHGIFTFLQQLTYQQYKAAIKMCMTHARIKKTKKPCDWVYIPTLTVAA
jgi:hypothetical protein